MVRRLLDRTLQAATAMLLVVGGVVAVDMPTAWAAPTISISPTTVTVGERIDVTTSGWPTPTWEQPAAGVGLCDRAWAESSPDHADALSHCSSEYGDTGPLPLQQTAFFAHDVVTTFVGGTTFRCSERPSGCVVAAFAYDKGTGTTGAFASTPVTIMAADVGIEVSPTRAASGAPLEVTVRGLDGPGGVAQCPFPVTGGDALAEWCVPLADYPDGLPASLTVRALGTYDPPAEPGYSCASGCYLVAYVTDGAEPPTVVGTASARVIIDPPALTVAPQRALSSTDTVTVSVAGVAPGPVQVAQCVETPFAYSAASCGAAQDVTVGADYRATTELAVSATLTLAGSVQACGYECSIVIFGRDGRTIQRSAISFAPPRVVLEQSRVYRSGERAYATLLSFPGEQATVLQCALPLGADLGASRCHQPAAANLYLNDAGDGRTSVELAASFDRDGVTTDCTQVPCAVAGFTADGETVASVAIEMRGTAAMTATPSTGLHDGDVVTLQGTNLDSGTSYTVDTCVPGTSAASRCRATGKTVTADDDGRVEAQVAVAQRFSVGRRNYYCRSQCSLALRTASGAVVVEAPFSMAVPTVSAAPATGLSDGDTVTIAGRDLQPTYAGPTVLFPTGGWSLVQCDASVGSKPTILEVFQQCAVPSSGAVVDVPGSTSSTALHVQGTITKILGGTTDCTASPGACVVGLARWEQDATTTVALTQISFG